MQSTLNKNNRLRDRLIRCVRNDMQGMITQDARGMDRFLQRGRASLDILIDYLSVAQQKVVQVQKEKYLKEQGVHDLKSKTVDGIYDQLELSGSVQSFSLSDKKRYLRKLYKKPAKVSGFTGRCMDDYREVLDMAKKASGEYLEDYKSLRISLKDYIANSPRITETKRENTLELYESGQYSLAVQHALSKSNLAMTNTKEFLPTMVRQLCRRTLDVLVNDGLEKSEYLRLTGNVNTFTRVPFQWTELLLTLTEIVGFIPQKEEMIAASS